MINICWFFNVHSFRPKACIGDTACNIILTCKQWKCTMPVYIEIISVTAADTAALRLDTPMLEDSESKSIQVLGLKQSTPAYQQQLVCQPASPPSPHGATGPTYQNNQSSLIADIHKSTDNVQQFKLSIYLPWKQSWQINHMYTGHMCPYCLIWQLHSIATF